MIGYMKGVKIIGGFVYYYDVAQWSDYSCFLLSGYSEFEHHCIGVMTIG